MKRFTSDTGDSRMYLLQRRRQLLALLDALGDNLENLDLQKLLFLYCQEVFATGREDTATSLYEFVPYRYGAFSFTCYADRRRLVDHGLLIDDDQLWVLTAEGKRIARETQDCSMRAFARRYHGLRGQALIAESYRRYPYYAIHSDIAERVLQNDKVALNKIRDARPERNDGLLFTIGYEGRTLESYLNVMLQSGVTLLCDVRRNAISRKYGFSKGTLAKACAGVDIHYQHLPELGIESRLRRDLETQADLDNLFRVYQRKILPMQSEALNKIRAWLQSGECVALTCYERKSVQCHRHCVAVELGRLPDHAVLFDQPAKLHSDQQVYTVKHL